MISKKRKKSSRIRGTHTCGRGFKKKARGSGHRGGFGLAGTGKRADQRKTLILNLKEKYFGRGSLKAKPKKLQVVNVGELEKIAKGGKDIDLKKYKLLGQGEIKTALNVTVDAASPSAIEKVKKAGGKVILPTKDEKKNEVKQEVAKENKE